MTLAERFFKEELELEKQKIESPNNRKQKTGDFQIGIKNGRRNSRREVQRNERNRDEKNKNQSNRNQKNKDLNNRSKSQSNENRCFRRHVQSCSLRAFKLP